MEIINKAWRSVMYIIRLLYYTVVAESTPTSKKTIIIAAIAYFFFPADLIPDLLPVIGVADDFGALLAGISAVVSSITPEIKEKAKKQ